jgi:ATP-dependent DNA ligase
MKASFIQPMLLLRTEKLREGPEWFYELKADGYRSIAFKTGGRIFLRSRNDKDFNGAYPGIVKALAPPPDETIIDGEVVALDEDGRPSFNLLQNSGSRGVAISLPDIIVAPTFITHPRGPVADVDRTSLGKA